MRGGGEGEIRSANSNTHTRKFLLLISEEGGEKGGGKREGTPTNLSARQCCLKAKERGDGRKGRRKERG